MAVAEDGTHNTRLTKDDTGIRTALNVGIVPLTQLATRRVIGKLRALAQPEFFEVCISREHLDGVARWIPGISECWSW